MEQDAFGCFLLAVVLPMPPIAPQLVHSFILKNRWKNLTVMLTDEPEKNSVAKSISLLIIAPKASSKSLEEDSKIENKTLDATVSDLDKMLRFIETIRVCYRTFNFPFVKGFRVLRGYHKKVKLRKTYATSGHYFTKIGSYGTVFSHLSSLGDSCNGINYLVWLHCNSR